jgi:putative DNA methylase
VSAGDSRKLIEVTLPLQEISEASVADKNRKVGTIKNLHKWFAPMPTPALRALIFATLVNDPDSESERDDLKKLVRELVPRNGTAPPHDVLERARKLIVRDNPELPIVLDPFCGGGSTVVEAQRLGLPTVASDLNPVAALITRVLGELLPSMADKSPVSAGHGERQLMLGPERTPFEGFAADLRYYGEMVQQAVQERLGGLYPQVPTGEPVAWLWCRTVVCPNPLCRTEVPLLSSPVLSKQSGRESVVEPVLADDSIRFIIRSGKNALTKPITVKVEGGRARFECLACHAAIGERALQAAGRAMRLGLRLMAVCVDVPDGVGRTFLAAADLPAPLLQPVVPDDLDEIEIGKNTRDFRTGLYGLTRHIDLYTPRQLAVLAAFADEVARIVNRVRMDEGSEPQAIAIASVLGLCVGKMAQANSMLTRWRVRKGPSKPEPAFGMQAMPMLWDFAESYPFGKSVGSWRAQISSVIGALGALPVGVAPARVVQKDAREAGELVSANAALLATDPPYFSQINYADLADYFYLWLRRAMRRVHPDLFVLLATPKEQELTANPARFGGSRTRARQYFIEGFTDVFTTLKAASRPDLPLVVAYAHKQDKHVIDGITSTGWAALLEAVLAAGLGVVRTWPIEATTTNRQVGQGANALATYVIMICRPRPPDLPATDRGGFLDKLGMRLPDAIKKLGHVAAVDLTQAAIGPGMEVFSSFSYVLEANGQPMSVPTALALINQKLHAILWDQETEFDPETRAAITWYDEYGWSKGGSPRAEQIAMGKDTTLQRLVQADLMWSKAGNTWLKTPDEIQEPHRSNVTSHPTVWKTSLLLSKELERHGVPGAARLMAMVHTHVGIDAVNDLANLLYAIGVDRNRTDDQRRFNNLVTFWPDIAAAIRKFPEYGTGEQLALDEPQYPDQGPDSGL